MAAKRGSSRTVLSTDDVKQEQKVETKAPATEKIPTTPPAAEKEKTD
jgi:hypothetical protein